MTRTMQTHEVGGHLASLSLVGKFYRRHRVYVFGHARTTVPVELGKRLLNRLLHKALHSARDAQAWTAFLRFCSRRPVGGPAAVERGATSSSLPDERSRRIGLTVTPGSFSLRRIISSLARDGRRLFAAPRRARSVRRRQCGARPDRRRPGRTPEARAQRNATEPKHLRAALADARPPHARRRQCDGRSKVRIGRIGGRRFRGGASVS